MIPRDTYPSRYWPTCRYYVIHVVLRPTCTTWFTMFLVRRFPGREQLRRDPDTDGVALYRRHPETGDVSVFTERRRKGHFITCKPCNMYACTTYIVRMYVYMYIYIYI